LKEANNVREIKICKISENSIIGDEILLSDEKV